MKKVIPAPEVHERLALSHHARVTADELGYPGGGGNRCGIRSSISDPDCIAVVQSTTSGRGSVGRLCGHRTYSRERCAGLVPSGLAQQRPQDPHTNKTAGPPGGKNSIQPSMDLSRVPSLLKAPSPAGCGGIGACCASSGTSPTPHWRRSLQTSSLFVPWLWLGRGLDLAVLRLLGDGAPGPTDQVRRQASPAMTRGGR